MEYKEYNNKTYNLYTIKTDKFKNCSRAKTAIMSYLLSAAHRGGVAPGPYFRR